MPRPRLEALIAAGWTVAATEKLDRFEEVGMKDAVQPHPYVFAKDGNVWVFVGVCYRMMQPDLARQFADAIRKCAIEAENCAIEAGK